jgi:hypothetical protein
MNKFKNNNSLDIIFDLPVIHKKNGKVKKKIPFEIIKNYWPYFPPQSCISISPHVDQHRLFSTTWVGGYDHDRTTHAYIITNEGATMLHNSYKVISEMSITVDDWMLRILTKNSVKLYNARPHLCYSPMRGDSDIR